MKKPFVIHVLCMDNAASRILSELALVAVKIHDLSELLDDDPELSSVRASRSTVEFYFTCTAAWILHLLKTNANIERLTYLDADLYFYSSPEVLIHDALDEAILISSHGDNADCNTQLYGKYNVSFLSFPRTHEAFSLLIRWRSQCIEWCYDRCEDGRFADQKYLDEWPSLYDTVNVISHVGVNVGPWNIKGIEVVEDNGMVLVNRVPLVYYHYERFRFIHSMFIDPGISTMGYRLPPKTLAILHRPYVKSVIHANTVVRKLNDESPLFGNTRTALDFSQELSKRHMFRRFLMGDVMLCLYGHVFCCFESSLMKRFVAFYDRVFNRHLS